MMGVSSGCGLCPWSCSGKVGAYVFCLVCTLACYTLSRKKYRIIIHRGVESTWGDHFYMGTQNWLKLEI